MAGLADAGALPAQDSAPRRPLNPYAPQNTGARRQVRAPHEWLLLTLINIVLRNILIFFRLYTSTAYDCANCPYRVVSRCALFTTVTVRFNNDIPVDKAAASACDSHLGHYHTLRALLASPAGRPLSAKN